MRPLHLGLAARIGLYTGLAVAATAAALGLAFWAGARGLVVDGALVVGARETVALAVRAFLLVLALVVVAGVSAFLAARRRLRPLGELAHSTERFLEGASDVPLPVNEPSEVGVLAQSTQMLMTELRQHTKLQRDSQARTRAILDSAADGIITIDEHGVIESFNPAAEAIFGYGADEVLGQNVRMLMPAPTADQHEGYIRTYLRTGESKIIGHDREVVGLRKDWTTFPMEISVSEIRLAGAHVFTGVVRDITARKRAEEAVAASEARLRAILDTAADGIVTVDAWGRIDSFNAAAEAMFGGKAAAVVGQNVGTLIGPPADGPGPAGLGPTMRAGDLEGLVGGEHALTGRRPDGGTFPLDLAVSELRVGGERLFTCLMRDITARKASEQALAKRAEELARSNEELAQFAYVASHDLQEPLRMVASYTQLLQRRYKGQLDADADEFIAYAVDGANRMQGLIRDLLTYSRLGTQGGEFEAVDAGALVDRAIANLQAAITEAGAVVTHDALPRVVVDPTQVEQLFQNLVANAVKFRGDAPPEVHVSATREPEGWHFVVQDNGIGIEPKYAERVFVIFQRLHTQAAYAGTGIGLAICKKIVERHGGRIWVESEPGQGAAFHFTLPDAPPA